MIKSIGNMKFPLDAGSLGQDMAGMDAGFPPFRRPILRLVFPL
jgi:hypothetical protein